MQQPERFLGAAGAAEKFQGNFGVSDPFTGFLGTGFVSAPAAFGGE